MHPRTVPGWRTSSPAAVLQRMRLLWVIHALCAVGFALAPLVRQGDYLVDALTLHKYWGLGLTNLAPLAACVVGLSSGLAGLLCPRSRFISAARDVGVLLGMLLVTLTYLQARQHVLMFGSICVAGGGIRPDPLAPILPMSVWWAAMLTHGMLTAATWVTREAVAGKRHGSI